MEMWDGSLSMYAQGGVSDNLKGVKVGSKIVVTNPDEGSVGMYNMNQGDVGKVIELCDGCVLAYNPKWNNFDRSESDHYVTNHPSCILNPSEYELVKK